MCSACKSLIKMATNWIMTAVVLKRLLSFRHLYVLPHTATKNSWACMPIQVSSCRGPLLVSVQALKRLLFPKAAVSVLGGRIVDLLGTLILKTFDNKYCDASEATSKQEVAICTMLRGLTLRQFCNVGCHSYGMLLCYQTAAKIIGAIACCTCITALIACAGRSNISALTQLLTDTAFLQLCPAFVPEHDAPMCSQTKAALGLDVQAEEWLVHCKDHLKPGTYALGTFTFADIAATVLIEYLQILGSLRYALLQPAITKI